MWTNIFLFLWIISTVIYRSTPLLTKCSKRVQRCPVKKDQWAQKNDLLNCTSFGYVCLRDANGYLYESCMANFRIRANLGNCPTLFACRDNKPFLGTDTTYYHCPEDVSGCPPRNHAEYSIHQLYKYPKCIESNFSYEMENTSPTSTTSKVSKGSSDLNRQETKRVVIPLVITLVIVAVLGCLIGYLVYSRKKKYDYSKVTSKEDGPSEGFRLSRMEENDNPQIANVENGGPPEGAGQKKLKDLRCLVLSMIESEADRVQFLPFKAFSTTENDITYVPVSIVDVYEIQKSDKRKVSNITPDKMFNVQQDGQAKKSARFIFMLGEAGYGKTIQCQRIAKSWCKVWGKENMPERDLLQVTDFELKEFDFLFFVQMRDVNHERVSLIDMIQDECSRYRLSKESIVEIRGILEEENCKCLVLLDGLDEWNLSGDKKKDLLDEGIPNCRDMSNCTILMTMRPSTFMEVEHIYRRKFDKVVILRGLEDDGIKELTTKLLSNYFHREEVPSQFEYNNVIDSVLSDSIGLKSIMKIPMLAVFCILIWHEHVKTGHCLTTFYLSIIEALIKRSSKKDQIRSNRGHISQSSGADILRKYSHVSNLISELSSLGKIALESLASENTTLVFSEEQLNEQLGEETLNLFLRIGLLSKRETSGRIYEDNVRITFLHKTIQEFVSSLYLFHCKSETDIVQFVFNEVTNIEKALEISTVLTFLSGLSPAVGCDISSHLTELSSEDEDISNFRDHFSTATYNKVFHLFDLQLSCYREVRGLKSIADFQDSKLKFSFSDIILLGNHTERWAIRETAGVLRYHASDIKSLCIKFIPNDREEGISNVELQDFLCENRSLVALGVDGYDRGKCRLFDDFSQRIPCLRTLGLFNVAFTNNSLTDFLAKEESRRSIKALGLFDIKPQNDLVLNFRYKFSSVRRICSARSGYVQTREKCSVSENANPHMKDNEDRPPLLKAILEVLPEYYDLSTLHVSYMDSDEDRQVLLQVLPEIKKLKHFGYVGSSIYAEPNCLYDADVIRVVLEIKQLRIIFLNEIILNENILNFEHFSRLKQITLEVFEMNQSDWLTFVSSVSKIQTLSKVVLNDTNIDKESCDKLKSVYGLDVVEDKSTEW